MARHLAGAVSNNAVSPLDAADIIEELNALRIEVLDELHALRELLERGRGPRDRFDTALFTTISEVVAHACCGWRRDHLRAVLLRAVASGPPEVSVPAGRMP